MYGVWKHVAVTLTPGTGILYVDGVEVARLDHARSVVARRHLGDVHRKSQYGNDPLLSGQIDELRIYSRALSATDVRTLFTTP